MNLSSFLETAHIEKSVLKVCEYIEKKRNNSITWYNYSEKQLWYELVSCILGSQVLYEMAKACTNHLVEKGLLDVQDIVANPRKAEERILRELSKPIYPPFENGIGCRYRYPKSKSKYIVATCIRLYGKEHSPLKSLLKKCKDAAEARETLINKCVGIGPKQASLFLRNISYCENLAIIDSHVIDFIKLMKLNKNIESKVITNKKHYLTNEKILLSYAVDKGKTLASLDLAIWIVMRVVKREFIS